MHNNFTSYWTTLLDTAIFLQSLLQGRTYEERPKVKGLYPLLPRCFLMVIRKQFVLNLESKLQQKCI